MVEVSLRQNLIRTEHFNSESIQFMEPGHLGWRLVVRTPVWRPPTDVYETDETIVVRVEIAGMRDEDFDIQLDDRFLAIRGIRQDNEERRAFHQMEIRYGEFSVEVELLVPVIASEVDAIYRNGFLRVIMPKARPRQIEIED